MGAAHPFVIMPFQDVVTLHWRSFYILLKTLLFRSASKNLISLVINSLSSSTNLISLFFQLCFLPFNLNFEIKAGFILLTLNLSNLMADSNFKIRSFFGFLSAPCVSLGALHG